ncbi:replication protein [Anaerosolibacter sp.]|uniref:replication protein n=1 Tax=Anaerosolibacter sp. TaxID=1872527 RepID=UPI0039EF8656
MADLENGYTRIANEILDHMARIKFSPMQYRILFVVWRYTYGFQRKSHKISLTFLSEATGCDSRQIQRELKKLIKMNVLIEKFSSSTRELSFNKKLTAWKLDIGETDIDNLTNGEIDNGEIIETALGEIDNGTLGEIDNQERNNKKNIKEIYIGILDFWNGKEIVKHKQTSDIVNRIQAAIKKYGEEKVIEAINNYATVYKDEQYFYSHIWRLDKFLKQFNGLPDFLDDGQQWLNYISKRGSPGVDKTQPVALYQVDSS